MNQTFVPDGATDAVSWLATAATTELEFAIHDMRALEEIARVNGSTSTAAIARQTARRLAAIRAELLALNADPEPGEFAALTAAGQMVLPAVDGTPLAV